MKPVDKVKELISKSDVTTGCKTDKRIIGDALEHMEELKQKRLAITRPNIWRTIMKSRMTKLAAAAVIMIAVITGLNLVGDSDANGVAFGDVVRPLLTARTATLTLTRRIKDQPPFSYEVMYMEPGHSRSLMPGGIIVIGDMSQGKVVMLLQSKKKATVTDVPPEQRFKGGLFEIRKLIQEAQRHEKESVEFLGKAQIDGQSAVGYRIGHMTIWADTVSELPIRLEWIIHSPTGRGQDIVTLADFVFDAELDESLFSLEIPEGYTVVGTPDADDFEKNGM